MHISKWSHARDLLGFATRKLTLASVQKYRSSTARNLVKFFAWSFCSKVYKRLWLKQHVMKLNSSHVWQTAEVASVIQSVRNIG